MKNGGRFHFVSVPLESSTQRLVNGIYLVLKFNQQHFVVSLLQSVGSLT